MSAVLYGKFLELRMEHTAELKLDEDGKKYWRFVSPDFMDEVEDDGDLIIDPDNFEAGTIVTIKEPE